MAYVVKISLLDQPEMSESGGFESEMETCSTFFAGLGTTFGPALAITRMYVGRLTGALSLARMCFAASENAIVGTVWKPCDRRMSNQGSFTVGGAEIHASGTSFHTEFNADFILAHCLLRIHLGFKLYLRKCEGLKPVQP